MFCKARKIPLPLQDKVTEKLEQMVRQDILEPVQPRGVTYASPVVWQRKKSGELRLCPDLKVHINGKVMDEDYPRPDNLPQPTWGLIFGKIDLSDAHYQIELDDEAKDICTINTTQGLFKMCRLPQGLKNSSSIFQNCIESTLKGKKRCCDLSRRCIGVWNYPVAVGQENACSQESTTCEKFYY